MILGVTRPSVSAAASELRKAGLIRYERRQVQISIGLASQRFRANATSSSVESSNDCLNAETKCG
jgi:hypothetical protein